MTKDELIRDTNTYVPISFDPVFKEVFGNEKYPNNTAYLASILLDIPYEDIKNKIVFKSLRHNDIRIKDKKCEKDIVFLVNVSEGYKINIEVNMSKSGIQAIIARNYYYVANLFGGGLREADEYSEIRTTIQYNLNNFSIDKENSKLERNFVMRDEDGVLSSKLEISHLNIAEMAKLWYDKSTKWHDERSKKLSGLSALILETNKVMFHEILNALDMPDDVDKDIGRIVEDMNYDDELNVRYYNWEEEQARLNRSILKEAKKRHEKMNLQELAEEIYELSGEVIDWQEVLYKKAKEELDGESLEQLMKKYPEQFGQDFIKKLADEMPEELKEILREKAKEEAIKQSVEQNKREMVLNMKEKGFSLDVISDVTKLSIEEVEKIIN